MSASSKIMIRIMASLLFGFNFLQNRTITTNKENKEMSVGDAESYDITSLDDDDVSLETKNTIAKDVLEFTLIMMTKENKENKAIKADEANNDGPIFKPEQRRFTISRCSANCSGLLTNMLEMDSEALEATFNKIDPDEFESLVLPYMNMRAHGPIHVDLPKPIVNIEIKNNEE